MTKPRKKKRHGGCKFTPELGEKISAALAAGQSILAIARIEGMPPESTIRRWGRNPKWSSEEFVAEYTRARRTMPTIISIGCRKSRHGSNKKTSTRTLLACCLIRSNGASRSSYRGATGTARRWRFPAALSGRYQMWHLSGCRRQSAMRRDPLHQCSKKQIRLRPRKLCTS